MSFRQQARDALQIEGQAAAFHEFCRGLLAGVQLGKIRRRGLQCVGQALPAGLRACGRQVLVEGIRAEQAQIARLGCILPQKGSPVIGKMAPGPIEAGRVVLEDSHVSLQQELLTAQPAVQLQQAEKQRGQSDSQ